MNEDRADAGPDEMLYDWFKHLTSLSLLTLGGVLSLSQIGEEAVSKRALTIVIIAVSIAGIMAFHGAERLVRAHIEGEPVPKGVKLLQRGAPAILGLGLGAFLTIFLDAM